MNRKLFLTLIAFFTTFFNLIAQFNTDSLFVSVEIPKSRDLLDYYQFEEIDHLKLKISGANIKDNYYLLTSNEYWDGVLTKTDTVAYLKMFGIKNGKDTIQINIISKKVDIDSIKFQYNNMWRFVSKRKYKISSKRYSLRDITNGKTVSFLKSEPIDLLVLSTATKMPDSDFSSFCELSKDGIPPEQWYDEFGVPHYIVIKFQLIE